MLDQITTAGRNEPHFLQDHTNGWNSSGEEQDEIVMDIQLWLFMKWFEMILNEYLSRFSKSCHKKLELTSQPTAPQRRHRTPWGIRNHSFFSNPSCKRILSRMILHVKKTHLKIAKKILEKIGYITHIARVWPPPSKSGKWRFVGIPHSTKNVKFLLVTVTGRGPHPIHNLFVNFTMPLMPFSTVFCIFVTFPEPTVERRTRRCQRN